MDAITEDMINQFQTLIEQFDEPLRITFKVVIWASRFALDLGSDLLYQARDGNVSKAHKMLVDCLNWRIQNEIDNILAGLPVIAVGVGLSTFDKASRKKDFIWMENVNGESVNILDGLELHTGVFSAKEQQKIVDFVYELQEGGELGKFKGQSIPPIFLLLNFD
ncbi:hypothetical protein Vadar_033138 [Vaccinium darrowii]|uniref:Uncharacterized protein n=1 Tax=Vaccinium darrowii TaxID=229202 RepID=A0ACB7Z969_9ERIC|nr:hypothetical protein Vadar_033138 [Vaccinium darrowii]